VGPLPGRIMSSLSSLVFGNGDGAGVASTASESLLIMSESPFSFGDSSLVGVAPMPDPLL
jgi:hypothetical protein